jgi:hypothetical protein
MDSLQNLWGREPALIIGLLTAAIALAAGFGLDISAEQVSLITAFAAALLSVVTRSQVSPTASQ